MSSHGDIRAHAILNHARVVATTGSVHATRSENPDFVFAGDTLTIEGDAHLGTYVAPTIEIRGEVRGGDYSFSNSLRADRFTLAGRRNLTILLCKKVSIDSYGFLIDPEASEILAGLAHLRQTIQDQKILLAVCAHECEQYANDAITYFVTGESYSQQIDDLNRGHRRLAFLDRVVAAIDSLTSASERRLAAASRAHANAKAPAITNSDSEEVLNAQEDLALFETEGAADGDLTKESEELAALSQIIRDVDSGTPAILVRLHEKKVNWLLERRTLLDTILKKEGVLKEITDSSRTLEKKNEGVSRVRLLSRLLASAEDRAPDDPIRARAQSRFIQTMLKTINQRRDRIKIYTSDLDSLKLEYEESTQMFTEKFQLPAPGLDSKKATPPEVTGRFEDGVTLCTERYLLDEASAPLNSVLVTKDCGPDPKTFRRLGNVVVEVREPATSSP